MTQRRVTRGRIVLAVVVVLVAAGVVVTIKTLSGGLPDRVYKLETACGGTTYEDAAPYTGPGPHPVAIFMPTEFGELFVVGPDMPDRSDWAAANPEDLAAVQLVACGTVESERRSADLVCGGYGAMVGRSTAVPMARATYRIRVYELRTHRELRSVLVEGEDTHCPLSISDPPAERLLSELTAAQWQPVLADLVEAAAR
ncbi:hypothetical protein [Amycolatopsis thermoflava]|uniref:hypothetical protein n=1 Tax=Amycolatopsis thermoflava TaxID=84480 RepID=UPI0012FA1857|nr:hypothetical protein [Amycolatopsis thermoflava]